MNDKKQRVLERFLAHAPFDGWSNTALERAAEEEAGDKRYAYVHFTQGVTDATLAFAAWVDTGMKMELSNILLKDMKIRDRITACVRARLRFMEPHKEAVRSLMGFLALPPQHPLAIKMLSRATDEMWYLAGDTSSDFSYYTKRLLLAGVYSSTLLYWLNDTSESHKDTEAFLHRRIGDVMQIQTMRSKYKEWKRKLSTVA